jgi:hypothetical protein
MAARSPEIIEMDAQRLENLLERAASNTLREDDTGLLPLAASTQPRRAGIVRAASHVREPAYEELIRQASQGEFLYTDDTKVRILELMGERSSKCPVTDDDEPKRTGPYTTGIVSIPEGIRVALYFSSRQYAGENLSEVLAHRVKELSEPIQMSDGLSRNLPRELATIVAN